MTMMIIGPLLFSLMTFDIRAIAVETGKLRLNEFHQLRKKLDGRDWGKIEKIFSKIDASDFDSLRNLGFKGGAALKAIVTMVLDRLASKSDRFRSLFNNVDLGNEFDETI